MAVTPAGKLRAAVADDWDSAVMDPFVAGLSAGTLPVSKMRAYLVQDCQFVDSFVALTGAAVAVADSTGARMVIARQLGLAAAEENTCFRRSFDALGVADDERARPGLLPPAVSFIALMKEAAGTRGYAACLAVLTVAEWLCLDWASRARARCLPARSPVSGSSCTTTRSSPPGWLFSAPGWTA